MAKDPDDATIRAHIQDQAGKLTIPEIQERVTASAAALFEAALAIDEANLDTVPPGEEEWTPRFAINHIAGWHLRNAREVLFVALTGEMPFEEEVKLPEDRAGMLKALDEALESLYIHVADAIPDYFLSTTWPHHMFGELNWREWFYFLRLHSMNHTRQLTEMQEAFAAAGRP